MICYDLPSKSREDAECQVHGLASALIALDDTVTVYCARKPPTGANCLPDTSTSTRRRSQRTPSASPMPPFVSDSRFCAAAN